MIKITEAPFPNKKILIVAFNDEQWKEKKIGISVSHTLISENLCNL